MLVKAPHRRVSKQNASAAVGLQAVLVGVDDNRIGLADRLEGAPRRGIQSVGDQPEVAAVSCVHVDAKTVLFPQRQHFIERVHRADGRRAQRHNHRSHIALAQLTLERLQAYPPAAVSRNGGKVQLQHSRDAPVRIVRLLGADDPLGGPRSLAQLSGHPQRLQVGQGAARCQMAQEFSPSEHPGNRADSLDLHLRAGPAAVARMVVRVDRHGQRIGRARHRVRRLEHLPGIQGMKIRVVVAQPARRLGQNPGDRRRIGCGFGRRHEDGQRFELLFQQLGGAGQEERYGIMKHGNFNRITAWHFNLSRCFSVIFRNRCQKLSRNVA